MAKDKYGNKKSMVSLSLLDGKRVRNRYKSMLWWLNLWCTAIEDGNKLDLPLSCMAYERAMIDRELSEYDIYVNDIDYHTSL